jgi:uncharacterized iron-regulated membrane protein
MKSKTIRRWSFVHTWTSLICTAFLLMLALTGLPLIFHHEIDHLLGDERRTGQGSCLPIPRPSTLQQLVRAKAEAHRPGEVMQYLRLGRRRQECRPHDYGPHCRHRAQFLPHLYARRSHRRSQLKTPSANGGLMMVMLRLHVDMFAGLPGKLLCWPLWGCCLCWRSSPAQCCTCRLCAAMKFATVRHRQVHPPALARPA